jgi:hypothetical protein
MALVYPGGEKRAKYLILIIYCMEGKPIY